MPTPEILAGVRHFQERFQEDRDRLESLAQQGQAPKVLFIACSDSRVAPELITGAGLGDLYVIRSMANVVPPLGSGEMGVAAGLEHAVLHLPVRHIVVCGHTDCGGIRALGRPPDWSRESHIARWIEHSRAAQTKIEASGLPPEDQHLATVRENVLLQLEHLRTYDPVRDGERAGRLTLHGWVYNVENGAFEMHNPQAGGWIPSA